MRNRRQVADQQRANRQHHQHLLPINCQRQHAFDQQPDHDRKSSQLGRTTNHQRHRSRCALVHVWNPHVERHNTQLEGQARHNKHQSEHQHLMVDMTRIDGAEHRIDIK